jgi:hypothetical protein
MAGRMERMDWKLVEAETLARELEGEVNVLHLQGIGQGL